MPSSRTAIVADASPLIALALVERLPLLDSLFGEVLVPATVAAECTFEISRPGAAAIQQAIDEGRLQVCTVESGQRLSELTEILDEGEAEAIVLARDTNRPVLMDERRGRSVALRMGLTVIGTAGLLITARRRGLVPAVAPLLDALEEQGYRMSDALVRGVLRRCGEEPQ